MPPTPARARFGALLREHRTRQHLRQADIGALVHVTADAVATWERGRSLPDQAAIRRLDRHLAAGGGLYSAWDAASRPDSEPTAPTVGRTGAASAATVLDQAAREAAQFGAWAERLDAGETIVTTLALRARDLADQALTAPPAEVVGRAADLGRV